MSSTVRNAMSGLLLVSILVLSSGCQSARNSIYCIGEDLTDIVVVDVTVSMGTDMGAHVMATELLQAKAYSYEDLYRLGIGPRHVGIWKGSREGWNFSLAQSGFYSLSQNNVYNLSLAESYVGKMKSEHGVKAMVAESVDEVGIGAHLFVLGGRIGFRPLEVVDLFANLITLDPLHDNLDWQQRKAMRLARKAAKKKDAPPPEDAEEKTAPESVPGMDAEAMQRQIEHMQEKMDAMMKTLDNQLIPDEPVY